MPIHVEPLTQGLVTAKDPSLLQSGELVRAESALYRPYNDALSPIKGRQVFGNTIGVNISGLRSIPFEADLTTTTRLIVAHGTSWQTGTGGAWTTVFSPTTGLRIEAIGFDNHYFLSNGTDTPQMINSSLTLIRHGMSPTDTDEIEATGGVVTGDGDWTAVGTGWYEYWFTEYDSVNDIESAVLDDDIMTDRPIGNASANNISVELHINYGEATYPILHNSNATHWRIYRGISAVGSGSSIGNYESVFPNGVMIEQLAIPGGAPAEVITYDDGIVGTVPYPFLTISVAGGAAVNIARDAEPPFWYTGDVFEDSIVVNDVANPGLVRYSFPGLPHSFPELYFVGFNTKQVDRVTCIKSLDAVCVVGLQSQVWRLNYLPNETDSEFSRGRCREVISANHGITGPDAACIFTPVEGASRVAYVSHDGLYMTDGIRTQLLTMDLDWDALVNKSELPNARLINVQHLWSLFLYYTSNGGSAPNNRVLHLSYHPQHLKDGGYLKVSGPTSLECRATDYANNSSRMFAATSSVQEEDAVAGQSTAVVETRFIYPEGASLATETSAERLRILTGPFNGAGTFNAAFTRRKSNAAKITDTAKTYTPHATENQLIRMELHARAEAVGVVLNTQADTAYVAFEYNVASGT